ncbi:hypothetical protein LTR17_027717, partial [Elasticomyces elasticus]
MAKGLSDDDAEGITPDLKEESITMPDGSRKSRQDLMDSMTLVLKPYAGGEPGWLGDLSPVN